MTRQKTVRIFLKNYDFTKKLLSKIYQGAFRNFEFREHVSNSENFKKVVRNIKIWFPFYFKQLLLNTKKKLNLCPF